MNLMICSSHVRVVVGVDSRPSGGLFFSFRFRFLPGYGTHVTHSKDHFEGFLSFPTGFHMSDTESPSTLL